MWGTDSPIAHTVTSDSSINIAETVVTHSSPSTSVIDFQTSLGRWRTVHQPHCQQIVQWMFTHQHTWHCTWTTQHTETHRKKVRNAYNVSRTCQTSQLWHKPIIRVSPRYFESIVEVEGASGILYGSSLPHMPGLVSRKCKSASRPQTC